MAALRVKSDAVWGQTIDRVIAAGLLLTLIGIAFLPVGLWLWTPRKVGGIVDFILLPGVMAIMVGSAAPIPILLEAIKIVFVLLTWTSLK